EGERVAAVVSPFDDFEQLAANEVHESHMRGSFLSVFGKGLARESVVAATGWGKRKESWRGACPLRKSGQPRRGGPTLLQQCTRSLDDFGEAAGIEAGAADESAV